VLASLHFQVCGPVTVVTSTSKAAAPGSCGCSTCVGPPPLSPPQAWAAIGAKAQPLLGMLPALRPYADRAQAWFTAPSRQAHQHTT
jgi:hypothetical protein